MQPDTGPAEFTTVFTWYFHGPAAQAKLLDCAQSYGLTHMLAFVWSGPSRSLDRKVQAQENSTGTWEE